MVWNWTLKYKDSILASIGHIPVQQTKSQYISTVSLSHLTYGLMFLPMVLFISVHLAVFLTYRAAKSGTVFLEQIQLISTAP